MKELKFTEAIELNKTLAIRFVFAEKTKNNSDVVYSVGDLIKYLNGCKGMILEKGSWYIHHTITVVASSMEYSRDEDSYCPVFNDDATDHVYRKFVSNIPEKGKIEITMRVID